MVEYAYHALAVDEKRANFKPTIWTLSDCVRKKEHQQVVEQVWFPGVHSNIGGGYPDTGLSDITMHWMVKKAKGCGLHFDNNYLKSNLYPEYRGALYNSKTGIYRLQADYIRPVNPAEISNESVHPSVYHRIECLEDYRPTNILSS